MAKAHANDGRSALVLACCAGGSYRARVQSECEYHDAFRAMICLCSASMVHCSNCSACCSSCCARHYLACPLRPWLRPFLCSIPTYGLRGSGGFHFNGGSSFKLMPGCITRTKARNEHSTDHHTLVLLSRFPQPPAFHLSGCTHGTTHSLLHLEITA